MFSFLFRHVFLFRVFPVFCFIRDFLISVFFFFYIPYFGSRDAKHLDGTQADSNRISNHEVLELRAIRIPSCPRYLKKPCICYYKKQDAHESMMDEHISTACESGSRTRPYTFWNRISYRVRQELF